MDDFDYNCCATLYPVMLVHGTAMGDRRRSRCWGRIPDALTSRGAVVVFGMQDAWGCTHTNKLQLAASVDSALERFSADKINIIAHSKGGLDARALTAMDGYADKIASITTISTPHRGLGWMTKIWPLAKPFIAIASVFCYPFLRMMHGDKKPSMYKLSKIMTKSGAEKFNLETPDVPGIYYQSYAGKIAEGKHKSPLFFTRYFESREYGDNDGLVSVESAKWGEFRGTFCSRGKRSVTHSDEIDLFKRNYGDGDICHDADPTKSYSDITQIYIKIVADLKSLGY